MAATVENGVEVPPEIRTELPYHLVIRLLGTYPKELKAGSRRGICTPTFTEALLGTARTSQQPDVHQQRSGSRKCGLDVPQNLMEP